MSDWTFVRAKKWRRCAVDDRDARPALRDDGDDR
jgi:hypothetical protein